MAGFKKATKAAAKLRAAVFGPSGSGKTFSSLRIATGLGGPIAVIDTEGAFHERPDGTVEEMSSAAKYADRFDFDVKNLKDKSIDGYIAAIKDAADGGYAVLVIDSLSHGWQTLLEEVEKLAKAKYRGNTWPAWSEGTPLQRKLVAAILGFPGHVIGTMRSKTEWTTVDDGRGKKTPQGPDREVPGQAPGEAGRGLRAAARRLAGRRDSGAGGPAGGPASEGDGDQTDAGLRGRSGRDRPEAHRRGRHGEGFGEGRRRDRQGPLRRASFR